MLSLFLFKAIFLYANIIDENVINSENKTHMRFLHFENPAYRLHMQIWLNTKYIVFQFS